ncbi:pilus assembly protein PilM [Patescibacteria group bacterium]|nr:pilus assembly protein PilM [Patescibacteria group bacterium]
MEAFPVQHILGKQILRLFPPPRYLKMPSVGIDISESSVRFLELTATKKGKKLGKFGVYPIPKGLVVDGEIKDIAKFSEELSKLRKKYNLDFVHLSLPEEQVYLFQTIIPAASKNEGQMRSILEFKLEENVPLKPHEAIFDYEIIGTGTEEELNINMAVYPRNVVESYVEALKGAGLTPLSLEIEAQSIARSVIPDGDSGTYMLVDFGRMRTGIAVVENGILRFTSTLSVAGESLTAAIQKHFSVTEEEADKIKNEKGFARYKNNTELFELLMNTVSALKDEVNKHYIYWNTRTGRHDDEAGKIKKIILCGGSSNLAGLSDYLSLFIKAPIELANVWGNVLSFEDTIPPIEKRHSFAYATAIGLALRNVE